MQKIFLDKEGKVLKHKEKSNKNTIEADKSLVGVQSIFEKFDSSKNQEPANPPSENGAQKIVVEAVIEQPNVSSVLKVLIIVIN